MKNKKLDTDAVFEAYRAYYKKNPLKIEDVLSSPFKEIVKYDSQGDIDSFKDESNSRYIDVFKIVEIIEPIKEKHV
jgi:hypothetical protein